MSEKIKQLQLMEQSLQQINAQKQDFQIQLRETDNALRELENTNEAYKILGGIMIKTPSKELTESLMKKKEQLELRIKTIEEQEVKTNEKAKKIQTEVLKEMKS